MNCDPTHELEEIILEPNPLHKKSQRLTKNSAPVSHVSERLCVCVCVCVCVVGCGCECKWVGGCGVSG